MQGASDLIIRSRDKYEALRHLDIQVHKKHYQFGKDTTNARVQVGYNVCLAYSTENKVYKCSYKL